MSDPTLKRKQPPTFRHLPLNRAKKLKQAWVENQKIKSKWKAQKRKEGLSTHSTEIQRQSDNHDADEPDSGSEGSEDDEEEEDVAPESEPEAKPAPQKSTLHFSRAHIHPELAPKKKRRRTGEPDTPAEPLSLRELTRKAYSRESLHTFKAGEGRRGGGCGGSGRGGGRGTRGRGAPRGETGRGQPNMKLRMDAMLEQIKQTMA
ncbi:hypothetical protein H0H87_004995 [Tephrocybe sp. NHM501043]|nr:hypothetical protein H0H87_004995 [Tephrocybe sp. NHM501043]